MFLFSLLLIGHLLNGISANTEIINFPATSAEFSDLQFTETWLVQISQASFLSLTKQLLTYKRHILEPKNSTLRWNMISAPLEYTRSQSICVNLHEWHPVQNINACPYEFWVVLDLDQGGWKDYDRFTLRLSWPAYVRFTLELFHALSGFR